MSTMSTALVSSGVDLTVAQSDRRYGGRQREILRVDGRTGEVIANTDMKLTGSLTLNGIPVIPGGVPGSGTFQVETLGTPYGAPLQLSRYPLSSVALFVNGQLQSGSDYTVSTTGLITWTCTDFALSANDKVEAAYEG